MPLPLLPSLSRLDAQLLLSHVLGKARAWVLTHPEAELSAAEQTHLEAALERLAAGVPLPYVLGHWEFFGLDFALTPDVLIPRPETELLVETALHWLKAHPNIVFAVDVGTGSGCISVALAVHAPRLRLLAVDRSLPALRVARGNALAHGAAGRIELLQADLLAPLSSSPPTPAPLPRGEGSKSSTPPQEKGGVRVKMRAPGIDLLLANLPYIPTQTLHGLEVYQREPTLALDGGPDGLDLVRRLLAQAAGRLAPGALALLEIEASQGAAALALARQHFPQAKSEVIPDLAGLDRLLSIQLPMIEE